VLDLFMDRFLEPFGLLRRGPEGRLRGAHHGPGARRAPAVPSPRFRGGRPRLDALRPTERAADVMMDEKSIREELRGWILARSGATPDRLSSDDQPILDDGLLSSLDIVEFILFIEEIREEEVDIEAIEPEVFNHIDALVEAFFPDAPSASEPGA
ncbi:MAG: acyl carrier protein, partial [Myxococcota bacterium]